MTFAHMQQQFVAFINRVNRHKFILFACNQFNNKLTHHRKMAEIKANNNKSSRREIQINFGNGIGWQGEQKKRNTINKQRASGGEREEEGKKFVSANERTYNSRERKAVLWL